jgi:hypothetical protein
MMKGRENCDDGGVDPMGRYEQAEMLAALWRLGDGGRMPLDGRLDRGLQAVRDDLPAPLDRLSFGLTAVGTRCYELADLVFAGQDAMLFEADGGTFTHASVRLDRNGAREIAVGSGLSTVEGERIGRLLVAAVG